MAHCHRWVLMCVASAHVLTMATITDVCECVWPVSMCYTMATITAVYVHVYSESILNHVVIGLQSDDIIIPVWHW